MREAGTKDSLAAMGQLAGQTQCKTRDPASNKVKGEDRPSRKFSYDCHIYTTICMLPNSHKCVHTNVLAYIYTQWCYTHTHTHTVLKVHFTDIQVSKIFIHTHTVKK